MRLLLTFFFFFFFTQRYKRLIISLFIRNKKKFLNLIEFDNHCHIFLLVIYVTLAQNRKKKLKNVYFGTTTEQSGKSQIVIKLVL